jgi:hypothetical protein
VRAGQRTCVRRCRRVVVVVVVRVINLAYCLSCCLLHPLLVQILKRQVLLQRRPAPAAMPLAAQHGQPASRLSSPAQLKHTIILHAKPIAVAQGAFGQASRRQPRNSTKLRGLRYLRHGSRKSTRATLKGADSHSCIFQKQRRSLRYRHSHFSNFPIHSRVRGAIRALHVDTGGAYPWAGAASP